MGWTDPPDDIDNPAPLPNGTRKKAPHGYKLVIYIPTGWRHLLRFRTQVWISNPLKLKKDKLIAKFVTPTAAIEYAQFMSDMLDRHHARS